MLNQKSTKTTITTEQVSESLLTFRVILKFWKKQSINEEVILKESECATIESFVETIKTLHEIQNAHCLEEIWIIQIGKEYDKEIEWIREVHGRLKFDIPQEYKDFLIRNANHGGNRTFEDPSFV